MPDLFWVQRLGKDQYQEFLQHKPVTKAVERKPSKNEEKFKIAKNNVGSCFQGFSLVASLVRVI